MNISSLPKSKAINFVRRPLVIFVLSMAIFFSLATIVYAQDVVKTGGAAGIPNPLKKEFSSVPTFIAGALKAMVTISLPILTLFIVYSGFLFVTARGNSGKLETAKNNFVFFG